MSYNKLLKEQSENILFQYFNEFKYCVMLGQTDFDKYLEIISIEDEIQDILDYNELIILKSLNIDYCDIDKEEKALSQLSKDLIPVLKQTYKDELKSYLSKELENLKEETETIDYYENKKDKIEFPKMCIKEITDKERKEFIEECNNSISLIKKKINRLEKAILAINI